MLLSPDFLFLCFLVFRRPNLATFHIANVFVVFISQLEQELAEFNINKQQNELNSEIANKLPVKIIMLYLKPGIIIHNV